MKQGEIVRDFIVPPSPKDINLEGDFVLIKPIKANEHSKDLFESNLLDKEGLNWTYLPYGPFKSKSKYSNWIKSLEGSADPIFLSIINKKTKKASGVASYLRIKPTIGSIEVGHINYSPLLQNTVEGTEAMFLMMKWVFDNGYRRYEWKCNAFNLKSRKAAQRIGFSYEGLSRQMTISKGRNRDTAWFAIIDKEWEKIKECFLKFLSVENFDKFGNPIVSLSSLTQPLLYKIDNMDGS
mgnify:FL=1